MKKQLRLKVLLATALVGTSLIASTANFAFAEDTTSTTVYVEGSKAQELAKMNAQSESIITKQHIQNQKAQSLEDIIFEQTGIGRTVTARGGVGISIRGADPRHTLVLVDNQPLVYGLSKFNGDTDEARRIGTSNVAYVDVIRGASSAEYGADAIGGVINIITDKPTEKPELTVNLEFDKPANTGTLITNSFFDPKLVGTHYGHDSHIYKSINFMANTGRLGKLKSNFWFNRREIPMIFKAKGFPPTPSDLATRGENGFRTTLRFFGPSQSWGGRAEYDINKNNQVSFAFSKNTEHVQKYDKYIDALLVPDIIAHRDRERNNQSVSFKGKNGDVDYSLELSRGTLHGTTTGTMQMAFLPQESYNGADILTSLDRFDQTRTALTGKISKAYGDTHYVTVGVDMVRDEGEGNRIALAPNHHVEHIVPDDYNSNLFHQPYDRVGTTRNGASMIHNYLFRKGPNGGIIWDVRNELYGAGVHLETPGKVSLADLENPDNHFEMAFTPIKQDGQPLAPAKAPVKITKEAIDMLSNMPGSPPADNFVQYYKNGKNIDPTARYGIIMLANPSWLTKIMQGDYSIYGEIGSVLNSYNMYFTLNGKYFGQGYAERNNEIVVGKATLSKFGTYISDDWQVNKDTLIHPVIRLDHSSKFGNNVSINLGVTHNLHGNPHARLKFNAGTGYGTPGLGELYYQWEMLPGKPGWYWVGNPDLKPEHSKNVSISLEGENKHSFGRVTLFHNNISDYMSYYFTGGMLSPNLGPKVLYNETGGLDAFSSLLMDSVPAISDRIYSFRNLGSVGITGIEFDWKQKFGKHWSTSLGYTYLDMNNREWKTNGLPKQLLDRPKHKVDIAINYDGGKNGWKASLWGDYYIHFLDGNAPFVKDTNVDPFVFADMSKIVYPTKTYGLWNGIIQKQINPGLQVYLAIDNIFNRREDSLALQERMYRMGVHMKLNDAITSLGSFLDFSQYGPVSFTNDWFLHDGLSTPALYDNLSKSVNKGQARISFETKNTYTSFKGNPTVGALEREGYRVGEHNIDNVLDKDYHGTTSFNRLHVDLGISDKTALHGEITAGDNPSKDTKNPDRKGVQISQLNLSNKQKLVDYEVGRIQANLGTTNYLFGQYFDGIHATLKTKEGKGHLSVGIGDFSHSTGIEDTAYNKWIEATWSRHATASEILGATGDISLENPYTSNAREVKETKGEHVFFLQRYERAKVEDAKEGGTAHRLAVLKDFHNTVLETPMLALYADPSGSLHAIKRGIWLKPFMYSVWDRDGKKLKDVVAPPVSSISIIPHDLHATDIYKKGFDFYLGDNKLQGAFLKASIESQVGTVYSENGTYDGFTGRKFTSEDDAKATFTKYFTDPGFINAYLHGYYDNKGLPASIIGMIEPVHLDFNLGRPPQDDPRYRTPTIRDKVNEKAGAIPFGKFITWEGSELGISPEQTAKVKKQQDAYTADPTSIPGDILDYTAEHYFGSKDNIEVGADNGSYADLLLQHQPFEMTNATVEITGQELVKDKTPALKKALYLDWKQAITNRFGVEAFTWQSLGGNSVRLADTWGIGASYQLSPVAALSLETGVNRSKFAKMRHDGHNAGYGIAALRIGRLDPNVAHSWSAYVDYKFFQKGSYLGGTGSSIVPDRYIDGVRSWTTGISLVPVKGMTMSLYYTFGAKGTSNRIGFLRASEPFKLDNMMRLQVAYKF